MLVAHDDGVQHGELVEHELVLLQDGHTHVGQNVHLTGGGVQLTGEDLQEGGFAGTVGADDAVAVAPQELQIDIGKERGAAVLQAQVLNSNHG